MWWDKTTKKRLRELRFKYQSRKEANRFKVLAPSVLGLLAALVLLITGALNVSGHYSQFLGWVVIIGSLVAMVLFGWWIYINHQALEKWDQQAGIHTTEMDLEEPRYSEGVPTRTPGATGTSSSPAG